MWPSDVITAAAVSSHDVSIPSITWQWLGRPLGGRVVPTETAVDDAARRCRRARTGEPPRSDVARAGARYRSAAPSRSRLRSRALAGRAEDRCRPAPVDYRRPLLAPDWAAAPCGP